MSEKKYTLTLTKEQLKVLSYACDQFSRLICGQDWSYQNLMEEAWEKRSKKATGKIMDKEFEGGVPSRIQPRATWRTHQQGS